MIRSITKSLSILLITAVSFTACSKDSDDALTVNKDNLVATYTLAAATYSATGYFENEDMMKDMEPCQKDDQIILKSDGSVQFKDAGTVCSPAGDGMSTWSVTGSTLILDGDSYTIKSLSEKKLVLTYSEKYSATITVSVTMTLNRN